LVTVHVCDTYSSYPINKIRNGVKVLHDGHIQQPP
jgi:hypothetical protein